MQKQVVGLCTGIQGGAGRPRGWEPEVGVVPVCVASAAGRMVFGQGLTHKVWRFSAALVSQSSSSFQLL